MSVVVKVNSILPADRFSDSWSLGSRALRVTHRNTLNVKLQSEVLVFLRQARTRTSPWECQTNGQVMHFACLAVCVHVDMYLDTCLSVGGIELQCNDEVRRNFYASFHLSSFRTLVLPSSISPEHVWREKLLSIMQCMKSNLGFIFSDRHLIKWFCCAPNPSSWILKPFMAVTSVIYMLLNTILVCYAVTLRYSFAAPTHRLT